MWNDRNEDGDCQIDEVDLFPAKDVPGNPADGGYWGHWSGPDLSFWSSSARLAPSRFTAQGVPIYERSRIQPFDYRKLAPQYTANEIFGSRAKPGPGTFSLVCHDGSLIICGQPYRVLPDLTLAGGPVAAKPSDYIPPINGMQIRHALHYAGSAVTRSPAGEVAMHVGDTGVWALVSVPDRVVLDQIFTGADGGWSTDLKPVRGQDVTGRKHDWETFFGHFIKADNGNYYTVAGKGFHGICRIDGLDAYQVSRTPVTVTAESVTNNGKLRELLVREQEEFDRAVALKRLNRTIAVVRTTTLDKPKFKLDGDVGEFVGDAALQAIDERYTHTDPAPTCRFGAVYDDQGLYLAYRGVCGLDNQSQDPKFLFKTGFAFDFRYRLSGDLKNRNVIAGDRRIVFGRHQGKWTAVLYDYLDPKADAEAAVQFASPVVTTTIARVTVLPADKVQIRFCQDLLELGESAPVGKGKQWSAEVFLPWAVLGFAKRPERFRGDVGVMKPDSGGQHVEQRIYWSTPALLTVSDLGVESQITPKTWGTFELKP